MKTEYKINELQKVLRRAFDAESNNALAKEILEITESVTVDGFALNAGFIATMKDDLIH